MYYKFFTLLAGFFLLSTHVFGQFKDDSEMEVENIDISSPMYRTGRIGVGFANYNAYNGIVGANPPRLLVRDGILGHHVSDTIGNFAGKWCGLGIGNPGGPVEPYGLAIADTGSVGFYNIIREVFENATRKNTVAGFGAEGNNANRFIIRAYSGTNAATGKNILIAIVGRQTAGSGGVTTASAIGNQQNTSLAADNIAVEGFRAQFPDFLDALANLIPPGVQTGGAVNVQVVNNPLGTTDAIASVSTIAGNKEYAEITW